MYCIYYIAFWASQMFYLFYFFSLVLFYCVLFVYFCFVQNLIENTNDKGPLTLPTTQWNIERVKLNLEVREKHTVKIGNYISQFTQRPLILPKAIALVH